MDKKLIIPKVGEVYTVSLSDGTTETCKLCDIIDKIPVFKTTNNRFLYFDDGENEFPNRYRDYSDVVDKMEKRDYILTDILHEPR